MEIVEEDIKADKHYKLQRLKARNVKSICPLAEKP